jgi:hypothetical protein
MPSASSIYNATAGIPAQSPAPTNQDNQATQNIIFGVFAIVLAVVAIFIGWLQLRSFERKDSDEETTVGQPRYELVEI